MARDIATAMAFCCHGFSEGGLKDSLVFSFSFVFVGVISFVGVQRLNFGVLLSATGVITSSLSRSVYKAALSLFIADYCRIITWLESWRRSIRAPMFGSASKLATELWNFVICFDRLKFLRLSLAICLGCLGGDVRYGSPVPLLLMLWNAAD